MNEKLHELLEQIREYPDITTLGQLRQATAALPDETPVCDVMGEPVMLTICPEEGTSGNAAVIS